ncbi:MAG: DUF3189 family protein [Syntrophomonadaceae bacterium]|jgi:hypothetical protein
MNLIFLGTTGVHHALVAANIYLDRLNEEKYYNLDSYADLQLESQGFPIYIGQDIKGNKVYSLGVGSDIPMAQKSIEDLVAIMGYATNDLITIPLSIYGDKLIRLISFFPVGATLLSKIVAGVLIKSQLSSIYKNIEEFKLLLLAKRP